jgi:hypothetical protein
VEIVFIIFIVVVVAVVAQSIEKGRRERWKAFAEARRLRFSGMELSATPRISGTYRNVPISIDREVVGSGKNRRVFTRYSAGLARPLPGGMKVTREGLGDSIAKLFGGQDIQLGVPEADRHLRIKGQVEQEVRALLTQPRVLKAVLGFLAARGSTGFLESREVVDRVPGFVSDHDRMKESLDSVVFMAVVLDGATGGALQEPPQSRRELAEGPRRKHTRDQPVLKLKPPPPSTRGRRDAQPTLQVVEPLPTVVEEPEAPKVRRAKADLGFPEEVRRLADATIPREEHTRIVDLVRGRKVRFPLAVSTVKWTTEQDLPEEGRGGHSLVGRTLQGVAVSVAFPKRFDDEVKALSSEQTVMVEAEGVFWDELFGRLVMVSFTAPSVGQASPL